MPFRFCRSFRIAPGFRRSIGTGGISTSLGGRGARVSFGRSRATATTVSAIDTTYAR